MIQKLLPLIAAAGFGAACQPTSVVDNEWTRDQPTRTSKPKEGPIVEPKPVVANQRFASAELRSIEATTKMTGRAELLGTPANAVLHVKVAGLTAGTYGIYLGRDCLPAQRASASIPGDEKGRGSAPPRTEELKVGVMTVTEGDPVEITAPVPADRQEDPPFSERTVILMPEDVAGLGHAQVRSACGEIDFAAPS